MKESYEEKYNGGNALQFRPLNIASLIENPAAWKSPYHVPTLSAVVSSKNAVVPNENVVQNLPSSVVASMSILGTGMDCDSAASVASEHSDVANGSVALNAPLSAVASMSNSGNEMDCDSNALPIAPDTRSTSSEPSAIAAPDVFLHPRNIPTVKAYVFKVKQKC